MAQATPDQMRLFVAQAIYKAVAPRVATKGVSDRTRFNAELLDAYETDGSKSWGWEWDGEHVADAHISFTKATESREELRVDVEDPLAVKAWLVEHSDDLAAWVLCDPTRTKGVIEGMARDLGLVADGAEARTVVVPGEPRRVKAVTLKVDEQAVLRLAPQLAPSVAAGMLTGGSDE